MYILKIGLKYKDMKKCVFTIVAKNYIGLGKILMSSVKKYNLDVETRILVADDFPSTDQDEEIFSIKELIKLDNILWNDMSLKYDITEFCTALKPFCFESLFQKFDKLVYLDPDILLYHDLDSVWNLLDNYSIVLTPHVARIHEEYNGELPENQLLGTGVFNLGFCAMKHSECSRRIINWWSNKLINQCFSDLYNYLYTDQHWMDLIPAYCPKELYVITDLGYNVAPWNFFERKIVKDSEYLYVQERNDENSNKTPLVFVHYSGYQYKELLSGQIEQKNIHKMVSYSDILLVLDAYRTYLNENRSIFMKYIMMSYSYNSFDHGDDITYFHRRLYNSLAQKKGLRIEEFYEILKRNHLIVKSQNAERESIYTMTNMKNYVSSLNTLLRIVFKVIGYKKYIMLIKAMRYYSRYENHSFLVKK